MTDIVAVKLKQEIQAGARRMGISDAELARRADITPEAFSRMGRTGGARLETIHSLAKIVGLRVALLPDDEHARAVAEGTLFTVGSRLT